MAVTISHDGYIKRNPVYALPGAAARRQRQDRHDDQRRRFCRVSLHRVDALVHSVLYHGRESVLDQSARAAAGEPGGARASRSSICSISKPGEKSFGISFRARISRRPLCRLRHEKRPDQKNRLMVYANPRPPAFGRLDWKISDEVIAVRLTDGQQEIDFIDVGRPIDSLQGRAGPAHRPRHLRCRGHEARTGR